eukprot:jgi/Mesvir1/12741/Mv22488-RA.1
MCCSEQYNQHPYIPRKEPKADQDHDGGGSVRAHYAPAGHASIGVSKEHRQAAEALLPRVRGTDIRSVEALRGVARTGISTTGAKSKDVSGEPRIKQCESVKSAANEIAATPRAKVDDKVYAKVFGMQNKSIMNMTADEFRAVQGLKKSDLIRDMWTEEMNSGAFFMNCVFKAAVSGGEDPVVAMERLSKTMTPTFKSVGLHDQAKAKRPREFLVRNKDMREGHLASKKLIGGSPAKRACLSIQS